jgi:hypothetical protein
MIDLQSQNPSRTRLQERRGAGIALPTLLALLAPSGSAYAECSLSGAGTADSPYLVGTYADLEQVGTSCSLTSEYRLIADIDASPSRTENGGTGFVPIGVDSSFSGIFHGAGHSIRNLTIVDSSLDHVGMFASSVGTIDSLGLVDAYIVGGRASAVGGFMGYSGSSMFQRTIVKFCYVTGTVSGGKRSNVGGLLGGGWGTISNSYLIGGVSGGDSSVVGGIAGANQFSSIERCFSIGKISGGDNSVVGGIVGSTGDPLSESILRNSYAVGSVSGSWVGGVAGKIQGGYIMMTYAAGSLSGGSLATSGGLAGSDYFWEYLNIRTQNLLVRGEIESSYWDIQKSGWTNGVGTDTCNPVVQSGLTTSQMRDSVNFGGFGFGPDSDWTIVQGQTFPLLRAMPNGIQAQIDAQVASLAGVHVRESWAGQVALRQVGKNVELDLALPGRVRLMDLTGRQIAPEMTFAAGRHVFPISSTGSMSLLQVGIGSTSISLPLIPLR